MAKPTRQPVTAATIAAAIASAPPPVADATAPATAPVALAPVTDAPVQDEQPQSEEAQAAVEDADDEPVEARVLIAFDDYAPNDIFIGYRDEIVDLEGTQKIDSDPKAVAYAKSLIEG